MRGLTEPSEVKCATTFSFTRTGREFGIQLGDGVSSLPNYL